MIPLKEKFDTLIQRIIHINILRYKPVLKILQLLKKITIPGFDGLPLYDVGQFFFQGISKGSIAPRASSIAFSFFLALFPMIIVFFTLIPFIPIRRFPGVIVLIFINNIVPDQAEPINLINID